MKTKSSQYYKKRNALIIKRREAGVILDDIAAEFRVTRERVRQIIIKHKAIERRDLLRQLKHQLKWWREAEGNCIAGVQYSLNGRILSQPTLKEIRDHIMFWESRIYDISSRKLTSMMCYR
jgi:hypothetical protein